ncbi:MAG: hypothetical protein LBB89_10365 [Treponema sp.]|jgi:hypothetical protein|nr:hypothetical protein [Treponema sp.]
MGKLSIFCILIVLFMACSDVSDTTWRPSPITPVEPIIPVEPPEPTDPAFWFGEVYEALIIRVDETDSDNYSGLTGDTVGQIANCQYVCNAINAKWGANTVTPVAGTETQVANCEYLLKMIDKANRNTTIFGTGSFATTQIVDVIAVNDAVSRLWKPAGKFVTVGHSSINGLTQIYVAYSTNGTAWTKIALNNVYDLQDVTYGNGKFVAIGGSYTVYSTDGINWNNNTKILNDYYGVTYGNGRFVAVGGNYSAYSTNGINWTTVNQINGWAARSVTYGNDKFVTVGGNGRMAYSTNGTTWAILEPNSYVSAWNGVTYGDGKFVAVGFGTSNGVAYSTDGINWTRGTAPGTGDWRSVTYGNGKFVAVGRTSNSHIMYSTDGINWSNTTIGTDTDWYGVTYGGEE